MCSSGGNYLSVTCSSSSGDSSSGGKSLTLSSGGNSLTRSSGNNYLSEAKVSINMHLDLDCKILNTKVEVKTYLNCITLGEKYICGSLPS